MSDDTRDATVRLDADVDPYRRQVAAAAEDTNKLAAAVDRLSAKLDGISKRAGKKLMLFGAGGAAGIAGITTEAAQFEKQLSTLNATAAVTDKTMSGFRKNISDLTKQFPVSRDEALQLVKTLDQLGIQSNKTMEDISKSMVRLSAATGENLGGLTTGMVELGRQMGTLNTGTMDQFANSLFLISKHAGVSSQQVLNFASSIAPAARAAGMSEQAVLGVSTAFSKAGQDGYAAATTFNSMLTDITRLMSTGSPEIAKYSNLIGVTVDQFKQMSGAEQLSAIFEAINKQGPDAAKVLDRIGYDGIRVQRAIQGTSQSGGLAQAIADATGSYLGQNQLGPASDKAMGGLIDQFQRMGTAMQYLATTAGEPFLHVFTPIAEVFANLLQIVRPLADAFNELGGLMTFIGTVGALGLGGAMMLGSKSFALAGARTLAGPGRSFLGGIEAGRYAATGLAPEAGSRGADALGMYMSRQMRWWHMPGFLLGHGIGQAMGETGGTPGSSAWRMYGGPLVSSPFALARSVFNAQRDFYRESRYGTYERSAPFMGNLGNAARAIRHLPDFYRGFSAGGLVVPHKAGAIMDPEEFGRSIKEGSKAAVAKAAADRAAIPVSRQLATSVGMASSAMMKMYGSALLADAQFMAKVSWAGGKALVGGAASMLFGHPLMAGLVGAGAAGYLYYRSNQRAKEYMGATDDIRAIGKYNAALGIATDSLGSFARATKNAIEQLPTGRSLDDLRQIPDQVRQLGQQPGRPLGNDLVKQYGGTGAKGLANYLGTLGITDPRQMMLAQADLVDQYGAKKAQAAVDEFYRRLDQGKPTIDFAAQARQTIAMQDRGFGPKWLSQLLGTGDGALFGIQPSKTAAHTMDLSLQEVQNQYNKDQKQYGDAYAGARQARSYMDFLGQNLPGQKAFHDFQPNEGQKMSDHFKNLVIGWLPGVSRNMNPFDNDYEKFRFSHTKQYKNMREMNAQVEKKLFDGGDTGFDVDAVFQMKKDLGDRFKSPKARAQYYMQYVREHGDKQVQQTFQDWKDEGIDINHLTDKDLRRLSLTSDSAYTRAIKAIGPAGLGALRDTTVQNAVANPGNVNMQYSGVQALLTKAQDQAARQAGGQVGKGYADVDSVLQQFKAAAKDATDPLYQLADAAQQLNAAQRQSAMHYMSRGQQADEVVGQYRRAVAGDPEAKDYKQRVEGAKSELVQYKQDYYDYLQSIVQAFRDYQIQKKRQDEDLQRTEKLSNRDFNISMAQAAEDYNIQRLRSQRDFNIQMEQAQQDFHTQMARSEEDFNRGLKRQIEDAAKTVYDPYTRIPVELTASLTTVLENLKTQNDRLSKQRQEVGALKKMGLTQEAIDTLQLMDPSKMRQVDRLFRDAKSYPEKVSGIIDDINKQVGKRKGVVKDLLQDPLNDQYRRMMQDHRRDVARATADFEKAQKRADEANARMLSDMADNYERMVKRATDAHNRSLKDMEKEYEIQSKRAKENLKLMGEEIFGTFPEMMDRAYQAIVTNLGKLGDKWEKALLKFKKEHPEFFMDEKDLGKAGAGEHPKSGRAAEGRTGADTRPRGAVPRYGGTKPGSTLTYHSVKDGRTVPSRTTYKAATTYDYSTNVSGNFQVVANDPNRLIKDLQNRARVKRLTRPSRAPLDSGA